ncbi:hypothetical protein FOZ61_010975 [Perkinsus olseni]|uniref:Uncharacterized protein n=1 Tax=Perkinsus olseni TaxID=32597 RepID=A0A7J6KW82_PEROL|nr:hypothetical protein FOZ61_010975 [Perkinsus olseni]
MRLFPRDPDRDTEVEALRLRQRTEPVPAVTFSELREAANGLRRGAAPGEDDVSNDIVLDTPEVLKDSWSIQLTAALKAVTSGSKLFERVILERLASCPQIRDRLGSPVVHGFCKGKSVDTATLRIINAFRAGRKRSKRAPVALIQAG